MNHRLAVVRYLLRQAGIFYHPRNIIGYSYESFCFHDAAGTVCSLFLVSMTQGGNINSREVLGGKIGLRPITWFSFEHGDCKLIFGERLCRDHLEFLLRKGK